MEFSYVNPNDPFRNPQDEKPFTWTDAKRTAARLIAQGGMTDIRIADECGVTNRVISNWRRHPDFQRYITTIGAELDRAMSTHYTARKRNRVAELDDLYKRLKSTVVERGEWFAEHHPTVPGGKHGTIVRRERVIGIGKNATHVEEFEVDKALFAEMRATLDQQAGELGQKVTKQELSGPNGTPVVPITSIIVKTPEGSGE
jgi:transposase-like protein